MRDTEGYTLQMHLFFVVIYEISVVRLIVQDEGKMFLAGNAFAKIREQKNILLPFEMRQINALKHSKGNNKVKGTLTN